jgi:hypothetical protein
MMAQLQTERPVALDTHRVVYDRVAIATTSVQRPSAPLIIKTESAS